MRKLILVLTILTLPVLPACQPPLTDLMFDYTGEDYTGRGEDWLSQVRGMAQLASNPLHPRPRTAPDVPVAYAGVNPFGINVFLEQEAEEWKRERSLQMIADAGFHWIRQEFPWEDIEIHGKGDFVDRRNDLDGDGHVDAVDAWAKYDHIVGLAERYGLEIVPRLSNPPAWSRALTNTVGAYAPPDDLADWGDYVAAVVSRYRGRVRYYQLWNEPNIYPEWGEQPVDPEGYTRLLCEGYARARQADPDAVIISGALAPTVALTWRDLSDFVFLQRMYDAGAAACFDILAVNDYMLWSGPTDRRMRPLNINFSRPVYIRDIMVANGDAAKPIWISEMNSNAVPNDPTIVDLGRFGQVTLEQQTRYAPLAYQRVMEEWPWVGVVNFWFFKLPSDARQNEAMYYFRMVEPDFTPLPVYEAMREYTAGLIPTLYPGVHQEDHWALDYEGGWEGVRVSESASQRVSESASRRVGGSAPGSYRRTTSPGATLRFTFEGSALTLIPGPDAGEVEVSVDGRATRRVSLAGRPVRLAAGWRQQRHEVMLTNVAGTVSVDELVVQRPWRPSLWSILGASALVVVAGWILRRRR